MDTKLSNDKQSAESNLVELEEVNAIYLLLMNLTGDGIIIVQDGVIKKSNPCMARLCGYHRKSMRDTALVEYFPPDENPGLDALIDNPNQESGKSLVREATLACKNGQHLKVEITAAGCTLQQKPASLFVVRDLSDRLTAR